MTAFKKPVEVLMTKDEMKDYEDSLEDYGVRSEEKESPHKDRLRYRFTEIFREECFIYNKKRQLLVILLEIADRRKYFNKQEIRAYCSEYMTVFIESDAYVDREELQNVLYALLNIY